MTGGTALKHRGPVEPPVLVALSGLMSCSCESSQYRQPSELLDWVAV